MNEAQTSAQHAKEAFDQVLDKLSFDVFQNPMWRGLTDFSNKFAAGKFMIIGFIFTAVLGVLFWGVLKAGQRAPSRFRASAFLGTAVIPLAIVCVAGALSVYDFSSLGFSKYAYTADGTWRRSLFPPANILGIFSSFCSEFSSPPSSA